MHVRTCTQTHITVQSEPKLHGRSEKHSNLVHYYLALDNEIINDCLSLRNYIVETCLPTSTPLGQLGNLWSSQVYMEGKGDSFILSSKSTKLIFSWVESKHYFLKSINPFPKKKKGRHCIVGPNWIETTFLKVNGFGDVLTSPDIKSSKCSIATYFLT